MKKILLAVLAIVLLLVLALLFYFKSDASNPYQKVNWGKFEGTCATEEAPKKNHGKNFKGCDYSVPKSEIPVFKEVNFPFSNTFDSKKSLPLIASVMIDVNNDGVDEVFISGGITEEDALFNYNNGNFEKSNYTIPKKPANTTTYGAVSFDLDNDGKTDLLLAGDYGVQWYRNTGNSFEAKSIDVQFDEKSVPVALTLGDIDRDGHADMFVSSYIKLDKMEGQTIFKDFNYGGSSIFLLNNGDNTFTDATEDLGLSYVHNTFMGILVDIDNDGFLDLVVAHDTGEVRTYKNNGGQKFEMKHNPTTGKYAYPMGIAVGDYNNDGNVDFFFSNTGSSVPSFLARGDLEEDDEFIGEWLLFRNEGNFKFTNAAKDAQIADFEFSWGAIFEDFNLDGKQDLVVAENYVDFPPHKLFKLPGRFLVQRDNGAFAAVEDQANAINKNYGITPLTSDFNMDGYPDLVFANISGPAKALLNKGGDANFISFRFPENAKHAGAKITVTKNDGSILSDVYVIGEGLASDQTSTLSFGLGRDESISSATIRFASGKSVSIPNPKVNTINKL